MSLFKGSGVALITPFDSNNNVDYETLKKLIDFHLNNKTDSIIICGTTGEASTLTHLEHLKCIEKCVEYVNNKIPVIAGTGSNSTSTAINYALEASKLGVDGLLIVTPYYNKTTQKGLANHYSKIASSIDIPIILYNVPSRTGINLEPNTVREIANNNQNVIGIKEASGNISQISELMDIGIDVYSGDDNNIIPVLSLGGVGVISVIANILPLQTHNLVKYYLNGNVETSRKIQLSILKLCKALFCETNPIPIKKAMSLMEMCEGYLREPLIEMSEENTKKLIKELKTFNLIP